METFKRLVDALPGHPFPLTHMGTAVRNGNPRTDCRAPERVFHHLPCNPVMTSRSKQPWVDMFDGGEVLAPKWRRLVIAHAERIILGFDNVWA